MSWRIDRDRIHPRSESEGMEVDEPESESGGMEVAVPIELEEALEPEPEPDLESMEWTLPENLTVNVDGKPAKVFVLNAHSRFDTRDFSKMPEQTQKLVTPLSDGSVKYVTLVEPGSICLGKWDLKEQYSHIIEKYLTHDRIFNLKGYVDEMSSTTSAISHPSTKVRFSEAVESEAKISETGTNAVFLDFSSYGREKVGLWDLSNMIAEDNYTPLETTDFLGVKLPNVPNGTGGVTIFAWILINRILASKNGPGRSRFKDVFFNTTVIPIMDMVVTSLASATPDFRLGLPLSFISYFLALITPPDNDIYIILTSCRSVHGMKYSDFFGPVTPATVPVEEQGALERFGALDLRQPMADSKSSSASLPSRELINDLAVLSKKYNVYLEKLRETQATIQLKQERGDLTGLDELVAEALTEEKNLHEVLRQIEITRARMKGAGGGARGEGDTGGGAGGGAASMEGGKRKKTRNRKTKKTRGRGNNKKTRGRRNAKGRGNNKKTRGRGNSKSRGRRKTTGRGNSKSRGKK